MNASHLLVAGAHIPAPRAWKRHLTCLAISFSPSLASAAENGQQGFKNVSYAPAERLASKSTYSMKSEPLASPTLVSDPELLRELAADYNLPMVPMLALQGTEGGEFEVLGLRDTTVVRAKVEGRTISLRKLGTLVESRDKRLDGLESGVMGARLLVAYLSVDGDVVGVVGSGAGFYLVQKMSNKGLAVSRLTAHLD